MSKFIIRPTGEDDREFVREFISQHWYGEAVVVHGAIFYPAELPGFLAVDAERVAGLITYQIQNSVCEIITLNSMLAGHGIGIQLIDAVKTSALQLACHSLTVTTTNDNTHALKFYQQQGFELAVFHRLAVQHSRSIKPSIPALGCDGIPIRDEIELEMILKS
jgi:GNAT superfamily N-acetyltransferase